MHRLRGEHPDERVLWFGHEELVEAIAGGDRDEVLAVMQTYYAHALAWADHLESQEARQSQEPRES